MIVGNWQFFFVLLFARLRNQQFTMEIIYFSQWGWGQAAKGFCLFVRTVKAWPTEGVFDGTCVKIGAPSECGHWDV